MCGGKKNLLGQFDYQIIFSLQQQKYVCLLSHTFKIEISQEKVTLLLLLLIILTPPYPTQKIDFIVIFNEVRYLTNSGTMLLHIKGWSGNLSLDDYY